MNRECFLEECGVRTDDHELGGGVGSGRLPPFEANFVGFCGGGPPNNNKRKIQSLLNFFKMYVRYNPTINMLEKKINNI
jgi:hypothetical protein